MALVRFFVVALGGLVLDLAVAYTLAQSFGVPLWIAAAIGFVVAAVANYTAHELWTFRHDESQLTVKRAAHYLGSSLAALLTRILVVAVLSALIGTTHALIILIIGAGVSFFVNFAISKMFVFNRAAPIHSNSTNKAISGMHYDDSTWDVPSFDERLVKPEKRHDIALVIPVINEGTRIQGQLQRIHQQDLPVDVIVADGGSTDGSLDPAFIDTVDVRAILTKTGPGKLSAQLRMAYAWCIRQGYTGIVTVDGNGKDGVQAVSSFVSMLEEGYDYVQGSRYLPGGKAENTPLERTIANRVIHAPLLSFAGRHWFTDTTNGFRAYSVRYLLDGRVQPFRDVFQSYELLFYLTVRCGQIGMKVGHLAVERAYPVGEATPTKISSASGKFNVLKQTFAAAFGKFSPTST